MDNNYQNIIDVTMVDGRNRRKGNIYPEEVVEIVFPKKTDS